MLDGRTDSERAIAGDPQALRTVWETNRRWLAAAILAHKPRSADLEDLLQDVAVKIVKRIGEVRDPATLRPWMRAIAINAARTAGRTRTRRMRLVRPVDADPDTATARDPGPTPGATAEGSMNAEEARRAMSAANRLPEEYREPLLLRCVRGMSYKQIADLMGVPVTTVETRLARARRMVREELEAAQARPAASERERVTQ